MLGVSYECNRCGHTDWAIVRGTNRGERTVIRHIASDRTPLWRDEDFPYREFHTLEYKQEDFFKLLHQHMYQLTAINQTVSHILMGRDMVELYVKNCQEYARFQAPLEWTKGLQGFAFCGITIHLIPWMFGILFLPSLANYKPIQSQTNDWIVDHNGNAISSGETPVEHPLLIKPNVGTSVLRNMKQAFVKWATSDSKKPFILPPQRRE